MDVVSMAIGVAAEPVAAVKLSSLNSISNKAKDQAWNIGDQAMRKGALRTTRGNF